MWLKHFDNILIAIIISSRAICDGFSFESLLHQEKQTQEEGIAIVNKLKEIIEEKEKIITTDIGIVSMLNKDNEYCMNDILSKLLSTNVQPLPWTIIEDSLEIQEGVRELMKSKTMLIFFVERNKLNRFETLYRFNYTMATYWTTLVVIPCTSAQQKSLGPASDWMWINRTMARIHHYNYSNAVLFSYNKDTRHLQMWTYNFYPSYRLESTTNVHEIVRDKTKNLMRYEINTIPRDHFTQNNRMYEISLLAFFGIVCEKLNASQNMFQYNGRINELANVMFPTEKNEIWTNRLIYLEKLRGPLAMLAPKLNAGMSLIVPRSTTSYSIASNFNSGVKLILIIFVLATFIWFSMPWCIKRSLEHLDQSNGAAGIANKSNNRSYSTIFMYCFASIMNVGINIPHQSIADRLFLAGFLGLCFFAVNSFQSDLISGITTKPKFTQNIQSLADFERTDMKVSIRKTTYVPLKTYFQNLKINLYFTNEEVWQYLRRENRLKRFNTHNVSAFIMSSYRANLFLDSLANQVHGEKLFYEVKGVFPPYHSVYIVSESVPYRQHLDVLCLLLDSNGLYDLWASRTKAYHPELNLVNKNSIEEDDGMVKFDGIKTIFLIPLVGGLLGIIILMMEILYATRI